MKNDYSKYFLIDKRQNNGKIKKFNISKEYKSLGVNKTFYIKTYGCQANLRDSEDISGILKSIGFIDTNSIERANLIVLNTCAIRENAEKKVFGKLGEVKNLKKHNKDLIVVLCGCMSHEKNVIDKIKKQFNFVDIVLGTSDIHQLPKLLYSKNKTLSISNESNDMIEQIPIDRSSKIKAYVNIMKGCDKFCSYCVVPFTRGTIKSRDKADILNEINGLIKQGYKEVTLLGQNVNAYGKDLNKNYYFWNLLEDVALTKIPRIRFVTSNPWNFDLKIVDVMKKYPNIMPYIHLPIQSGNESILKQMNRPMKINDYIKKIDYIRKNIDDCAISTDIIVGFPNETKTQFNDTIKLYNKVKFDNAYTFVFSSRPGTPASKIIDKTKIDDKNKRLLQLNELVKKYAKWNNEKYVSKTIDVLVEGYSKTNKNVLTGYSPQWKVVNFIGKAKVGEIVKVKITSSSRFSLNGEVSLS